MITRGQKTKKKKKTTISKAVKLKKKKKRTIKDYKDKIKHIFTTIILKFLFYIIFTDNNLNFLTVLNV